MKKPQIGFTWFRKSNNDNNNKSYKAFSLKKDASLPIGYSDNRAGVFLDDNRISKIHGVVRCLNEDYYLINWSSKSSISIEERKGLHTKRQTLDKFDLKIRQDALRKGIHYFDQSHIQNEHFPTIELVNGMVLFIGSYNVIVTMWPVNNPNAKCIRCNAEWNLDDTNCVLCGADLKSAVTNVS